MAAWHMHEWGNYAVCVGAGAILILLLSFFRKNS